MSGIQGDAGDSLGLCCGPHGGASLCRGLPLPRDHPGCQLAGSHGLVHAALNRRGSGILGAPSSKVDCFLGLLCYIYSH